MASRRARQRLKGGGGGGGGGGSGGGSGSGGDAGPAAEKLRELLGSREAGVEPRPECVCGWRAWPAGGSGGSRGLGREPGSALLCSLLRAVALLSTGVGGLLTQSGSLTPASCESVRVRVALLPSAGPCIFAARVCHASGSTYMRRLRVGRVSRAFVGAFGRRVCLLYPSLTAVYWFLPPSAPPALEPPSLLSGNL